MLIYTKGIYEIIMCKDQKHDKPCNFKLEDSDVEQFIATMEEATKDFFSKQPSTPKITLEDIEDLLRREVPKDPIKLSDQYMYHFQCPTCHNESIYATKNKRCMHCGQVLDWSNYEEN